MRHKNIFSILAISVLLSFSISAGNARCHGNKEQQDKYGLDQSIASYNKSIESNPKDHHAYYDRASAYEKKGDPDQAIADYNKAISIKPDYPVAHYNRGLAYYKMKKYDKAWSDVHTAEELGYKADYQFLETLKKDSNRES